MTADVNGIVGNFIEKQVVEITHAQDHTHDRKSSLTLNVKKFLHLVRTLF